MVHARIFRIFRLFRRFRKFWSSRGFRRCRIFRKFRSFCIDSGTNVRCFSRLHRASDSTRSAKSRTSVFAGRRSTFKGSQTLPKKRKSTKIDEKSLRRCFVNALHEENSIFPFSNATWRRFWSPRRAPGRSRAPFLASWVALGDSPGTPGGRRGRSGTLPRRSRDAFGTLLDATGSPERVQAAILSRFWLPRGVSGDRSSVDFRCVF